MASWYVFGRVSNAIPCKYVGRVEAVVFVGEAVVPQQWLRHRYLANSFLVSYNLTAA